MPKQFQPFGCELACPAFRANIVQWRGNIAGTLFYPVLQPGLYNLEARDRKLINFMLDGGKPAVADVQLLSLLIVAECFRVAVDGRGNRLDTSGLARSTNRLRNSARRLSNIGDQRWLPFIQIIRMLQ
jgi:hypothetical protein